MVAFMGSGGIGICDLEFQRSVVAPVASLEVGAHGGAEANGSNALLAALWRNGAITYSTYSAGRVGSEGTLLALGRGIK